MRITSARAAACKLLPLLALMAAGCGSEDTPAGPSAGPPELATTTLPSFVQVSTGDLHTCAVTTGGLIYCWGNNYFGQLGDSATQNRLTPVRVHGGALRFRRVVAGLRHTCAETTEGKAYCWGENLAGVLGSGWTFDERHTPAPVAGGHTFRLIDGGDLHVCGVTTSGQVYCWGSNDSGEVGRPASVVGQPTPVLVPGNREFTKVSAGGSHTCGVTVSSVVYCWGDNSDGQLGDSTMTSRSIPMPVYGRPKFKQVSAGALHTCGLTIDDRAFCWGNNAAGQLGDRTVGLSRRILIPHAVMGDHRFQGLTAGVVHNCAIDLSGRAYCWGGNQFGQLGDGTTALRRVPVTVHSQLEFKPINTGPGFHTCGVAGGKVYCWGSNAFGALGDGTTVDHSLPAPVKGGS
jgi:alpha-tubulin suppressor-like RCC1 family protein